MKGLQQCPSRVVVAAEKSVDKDITSLRSFTVDNRPVSDVMCV